ncbi:hypothetical protein [Nonomuraea sp. NPDC049695]|uniref:hypothetical protein n=1 Tax=Nonomuraea sp. NPDC049695 TaxID=3154734 RepID=UPI003435133F
MDKLHSQSAHDLQEVGASGIVRDARFLPASALALGVMGQYPAQVTTSGIESVICCHSALAWA